MSDQQAPKRRLVRTLIRWCLHTVLIVIAILATLLLVGAFRSRGKAPLETWHHSEPEGEFRAADLAPDFGLAEYLAREQTLFDGLSAYMLDPADLEGRSQFSRFVPGGPQDPARQPRNWNRTNELVPDDPKGGVLLLHGLSDSPYSLRSLAELLFAEGYYVLAMRMPGHGTVPAGLLDVTWRDWAAAVQVGARHVRGRIDASQPFYIGGYSNGGALAVHYTLAALEGTDPVPEQLFLFSPAIGITPFARAARWDMLYGFIPYFEQSRWLDIEPEYDPYKYNSFPKNAGTQSWGLARAIQLGLDSVESAGRLAEVPPILTFQSVVDDTVEVPVLMTGLYQRLEPNGSEVVFYDVNRAAYLETFISLDFSERLERLMQMEDLDYTVTRVTNRDAGRAIEAQSRAPGAAELAKEPLDLEWPVGVFSLAHVAIPFPPNDPLYGAAAPVPPVFGLHIGSVALRGERRVLRIPASQLIRIRHNPFHADLTRRVLEALDQ